MEGGCEMHISNKGGGEERRKQGMEGGSVELEERREGKERRKGCTIVEALYSVFSVRVVHS